MKKHSKRDHQLICFNAQQLYTMVRKVILKHPIVLINRLTDVSTSCRTTLTSFQIMELQHQNRGPNR